MARPLSFHLFITTFLLLLGQALSASSAAEDDDQCGLYLAVSSTTRDYTVWGVYAGKDYKQGDVLGSPDLAVNTVNLRANNVLDEKTPDHVQDSLMRTVEFLEESFWVPDSSGGKFEVGDRQRIITAISGPGFLGAFDPSLTNADWDHGSSYKRPSIGERPGVSHPGRGAITPFYNTFLRTVHDVKAGSEVMINYGSNYEADQKKDDLHRADFARIDETVEQMIEFFNKHRSELDKESKMEIYNFIRKDVMNAAVGPKKARKITDLLPENPDDLIQVKVAGGTLAFSQPAAFRTVEWLEEHGRCMDNIRVGASTIPDAGRGAFAKRKIKKGKIVTPLPLLQIPNSEILDTHPLYFTDQGDWARDHDEITGRQLLINYCLGHPSSTMMFYPTGGGGAAINHSDKPNAKMVWSDHPSNQKDWFDLDPMELVTPDHVYLGLLMEIVATEDIEEGQEIFIDYGKEWSDAWKEHVKAWDEAKKNGGIPEKWPARAVEMNDEYSTKPFKTEAELKEEPYPEGVAVVTFLMIAESSEGGTEDDPKVWSEPAGGTAYHSDNLFEPEVVGRVKIEDDNIAMPYNYTVRWTNNKGDHTFVKNIPHGALLFVDEPEMGDQFVENPFRHFIGIPDDIFPQGAWRNLQ